MANLRPMRDVQQDIHFPKAGVDLSLGYARQPARPAAFGEYARTCALGNNVRAYDAVAQRFRGGSRPGLTKFVSTPVVSGWIVQHLELVVTTGTDTPGGSVAQSSLSGRVVTLVAVSQGQVYALAAGGTAWSQATNSTGETPPLNYSGVMRSAVNNQRVWFADGINYAYYDPKTHTVYRWQASAGTLPADSANNTPRLICTWRGRTVLSGLLLDPQNWFMSRVGDPTDFDYGPASFSPAQAVAGNNAPQGLIGDVITALIPYSDDVLIFGGDHTIYMMRGDPLAGGQIDLVTDAIGIGWGEAWCRSPDGTIWFFSNRTGIFTLVPGQQPVRMSQQIDSLLKDIDTGAYGVRLVWNDRYQGVHVFVTKLEAPGSTTHFFYETRTGAWWTDTFGSTDLDPLCAAVFDGNRPDDRVALIGCWDGYVRAIDPAATDDDGVAISSTVVIGPLLTQTSDEMMLREVQGVLADGSGTVTWDVLTGATAQTALASSSAKTGTFSGGRGLTQVVRRSGHAVYLKLTSVVKWAMESIRVVVGTRGDVRRRGA